ncbi:hypothetical protein ACGFYU_05945 [Streptomyces sp. NPDC048337]|uniref:hypothetical protein n=1 Tax=Streptomyces sp. NPDC048337 TaxID=3365535 RepID=UPI00370FD55E
MTIISATTPDRPPFVPCPCPPHGTALRVRCGALTVRVDAERDRLRSLLDESLRRIGPEAVPVDTVRALQADHRDADGLPAELAELVEETVGWTALFDLGARPLGLLRTALERG